MHETMIAADCRIEGQLTGQVVRIFGQVTGAVEATEVIVEAGAQIGGGIHASGVRVLGRVDGAIRAERVIVEASGQSLGGISAPSVTLAEGCTIQGRLDSNLPAPAVSPLPVNRVEHATAPPAYPAPRQQHVTPYTSSLPQAASGTPMPAAALPVAQADAPPPTSAPKVAPRAFNLDGVKLHAEDPS